MILKLCQIILTLFLLLHRIQAVRTGVPPNNGGRGQSGFFQRRLYRQYIDYMEHLGFLYAEVEKLKNQRKRKRRVLDDEKPRCMIRVRYVDYVIFFIIMILQINYYNDLLLQEKPCTM